MMKKHTLLILVLPALLMGCSKLTVTNYDKLKTGLAYEEVVKILGKPTACDEVLGLKSCQWGDENKQIFVSFLGGNIVLTSAKNIQ